MRPARLRSARGALDQQLRIATAYDLAAGRIDPLGRTGSGGRVGVRRVFVIAASTVAAPVAR